MIIPHIPFFHRFTSSITHELSIITNRLNALQGNFHTLKMVPKNLIILSRNIISNVNFSPSYNCMLIKFKTNMKNKNSNN